MSAGADLRGVRGAAAVAVALLLWGAPSHAVAESAFSLEALLQRLAAVPASTATFVETKEVTGLDAPLTSSGELHYRAPDYLLKAVQLPEPERYELAGDRLSIESAAWGRRELDLRAWPQLAPLVTAVRATLAGDGVALERFWTVTLSGAPSAWLLWLEPRQPAVAEFVRAIAIRGVDAAVTEVETYEGFGTRSRMIITGSAG